MHEILQRLFGLATSMSTLIQHLKLDELESKLSLRPFRHLPTHGPGYIKPLLDYKLPCQIPLLVFIWKLGWVIFLTPVISLVDRESGFNCRLSQLVVGSSCWLGLSPKIKPSCPNGSVHLY